MRADAPAPMITICMPKPLSGGSSVPMKMCNDLTDPLNLGILQILIYRQCEYAVGYASRDR